MVTGAMMKALEALHHQANQRIAGMTDRRTEGGEWEYPPVADVLEAPGLYGCGQSRNKFRNDRPP